jgi:hypothetical protein
MRNAFRPTHYTIPKRTQTKGITMNRLGAILKYWIPLAAAITLISALIYLTVQQDIRIGSNDPQIQMAEDAARAFAEKQPLETILPAGKVEISQSLAPYMIVFDASGTPLGSNALLHGSIPEFPKSVLDYTRQNGEDRVTWQPETGVRSAVVIVPIADGQDGFVLAGRSLRESEKRVDLLTTQVAAGWAGTLLASLALVFLFEFLPLTRPAA